MKSILPVVNGVLMALTEIFNIIATLVGFKLDEFDYSGLAGVSDYANDIIEGFDGAGASVDKLKKKLSGLRSFDKLNVISSQKGTSSGTGSGSGTIDPKILKAFSDAFSGYNDQLDKVKMKANDIRDSIMDWLGFTKEVNPITGEVSWKYEGIGTTLKNIWESFKKLNPLAKIFVGLGVWKTFKLLFTWGGKLLNLLGVKGLSKSISNVLTDLGNINKDLPTISSNMDRLKTAIGGVIFVSAGMSMTKDAIDDINKSGQNLGNTIEAIGGNISQVFGGALIGSAFGPVGTIIGAVAGAFQALYTTISSYKNYGDIMIEEADKQVEANSKALQSYKDFKKGVEDEMNNLLAGQTYRQQLLDELSNMVDENGNLIDGYETRANFILGELNSAYGTEYTLLDLQKGKYKEIKDKVYELIKAEKARIVLNANKEIYEEAIKNETQAWYDLNEAEKALAETNRKSNELLEKRRELLDLAGTSAYKNYEYTSELTGETYKGQYAYMAINADIEKYNKLLEKNSKAVETANELYTGYKKDQIFYEDLSMAILEGDTKKQEEIIKKYTNTVQDESGKRQMTAEEELQKLEDDFAKKKQIYAEQGKEISDAEIKTYKERRIQLLLELGKTEDEVVQHFYDMGSKSSKEFITEMEKLPPTIQKEIIEKMEAQGVNISKELQKGIDKIKLNATMEINANTTSLKTTLKKLSSSIPNINSWLKMAGINVDKLASGGMPKVGNMFLMNEEGPELLGTVGGKSFVANQNQMMDLLDKKIGNAQNNTRPQVFNIYLDENHKLGSYTIEQLQNIAKTDGKPITIG